MNDRGKGLFPSHATEEAPPNPAQLIHALRQIGYSFEQAISDLVDNSINARASKVLVRLVHSPRGVTRLLVVDNGHGMIESVLKRAMRFGAHEEAGPLSLGKFGMGMKLASFSHAKTLNVYTMSGGTASGRAWTMEGISNGWKCDVLETDVAERPFKWDTKPINARQCGTIIEWTRIDRLPAGKNGVEATVGHLLGRLRTHLGLFFHRFLESGRLSITLDSQKEGATEVDRATEVTALNPFLYPVSGDDQFPQEFPVELPSVGRLRATAHIWPPNSKSPEYSLGNRAASRQGFYFYRNDRLIQAGGWNGVVEHESEPHMSLARVAIDLPTSLDEHFALNVQKSSVNVPPAFSNTVAGAKSAVGNTFAQFRAQAQKVYRKKDTRVQKDYPLVPSTGLPRQLAVQARAKLGGSGRVRNVAIVWATLEDDEGPFKVDRQEMRLIIDKGLRRKLLAGRRASAADLPVVKLLLFLLLQDEFDRERSRASNIERLSAYGELISLAARLE